MHSGRSPVVILVLTVQSYQEEEETISPQPTISEVKQAWIAEATKLKLIEGPQDTAGLQELKKALGATYANLTLGCKTAELQAEGLNAIRAWLAERMAA